MDRFDLRLLSSLGIVFALVFTATEVRADSVGEFCAEKKIFLLSQFESRVSVSETIEAIVSKPSNRLVQIGETHSASSEKSRPVYEELLNALSQRWPDLDCVITEYPVTQPDFKNEEGEAQFQIEWINKTGPSSIASGALEELAVSSGFKVFRIDDQRGLDPTGDWRDTFEVRDARMAEALRRLMMPSEGSPLCRRAILLNGSLHVSDKPERKTLSEWIKHDLGIASYKMRLIDPLDNYFKDGDFEYGIPDAGWFSYSLNPAGKLTMLCPESPGVPRSTFIINGSPFQTSLPFSYDGSGGYWRDYDAAVVLGTPNPPNESISQGYIADAEKACLLPESTNQ